MQKVLVVGGSGDVATLILPYLSEKFAIRVFDLRPPHFDNVEYFQGDVTDLDALRKAAEGCDLLAYLAMYGKAIPGWNRIETAGGHFDVSVKGVYLALGAAQEAGIKHAVYASSMSVYDPLHGRYFPHEFIVPDATGIYGLAKRMGEEVCQAAVAERGMTVTALRLCRPMDNDEWEENATKSGENPFLWTRGDDVARAFIHALERPLGGFDAFTICGDWRQKVMNLSRARDILGWEPLARPSKVASTASTTDDFPSPD
jgi:nucleoside-diphosphate-sugar epimerase